MLDRALRSAGRCALERAGQNPHPSAFATASWIFALGSCWPLTRAIGSPACDASHSPAATAYWFERTLSRRCGAIRRCATLSRRRWATPSMANQEDVLFIPWGLGANGKSAIFDDGVLNMLGQYGAKADAGTFVENENSKGASGGGPRRIWCASAVPASSSVGETVSRIAFESRTSRPYRVAIGSWRVSLMGGPAWSFIRRVSGFMPTNHKPIIRGMITGYGAE